MSDSSHPTVEKTTTPEEMRTKLLKLFGKSLLLLGERGDIESACKLAAQGWSLLRHNHPRDAEYLNGILHALTAPRKEAPPQHER